jgi:hypothetical protein
MDINCVTNFKELVSTPFVGEKNAICWARTLQGDFSEVVEKLKLNGNIKEIEEDELRELQLSDQGAIAREFLLQDFKLLKDYGAAPVLNLIKQYDADHELSFFPTDVYSFHVDRSPIPIDTFLCTYYGDTSQILPNAQAIKKVDVPEIRSELKRLNTGMDDDFETFLSENFFDLHYIPTTNAKPISLGLGNLWRLATDHPESVVPPCIHRAPREISGQTRLLMIC